MAQPNPGLEILCFGDSLTEGYTFQASGKFHPYSIHLKKLFSDSSQDAVIDTAGVSGEEVIPSMPHRLGLILCERDKPYDWIIILGGTNDLGVGNKGEDVLSALIDLHDRAKRDGKTKTIALSIPQYLQELKPLCEDYRSRKQVVNDGLKAYCESSNESTIFVDLWNELPFGALPDEERKLYWVDGLHMTPRGYDRMATIIFNSIKGYI